MKNFTCRPFKLTELLLASFAGRTVSRDMAGDENYWRVKEDGIPSIWS